MCLCMCGRMGDACFVCLSACLFIDHGLIWQRVDAEIKNECVLIIWLVIGVVSKGAVSHDEG